MTPASPDLSRHAWADWLPQNWAVWRIPGQLLISVLAVEGLALLLCAALLLNDTPAVPEVVAACMLTGLGVLHAELTRGIERTRWRIGADLHVDLSSVWLFAAAVLFAPGVAGVVAVIVHGYTLMRARRMKTPLFKHLFSVSTSGLAAISASALMGYLAPSNSAIANGSVPLVVMAAGMAAFFVVNSALVAGAIAVSAPGTPLKGVVGEWHENLLEWASYCLGALVAVVIVAQPLLVVLVFPPLLVLHRAMLVRQLEEKASTDGKTGLLNAAAWHTQAEKELRRARKRDVPRGVLVVDLDHFKQVNDRHGHLAGDQVLSAVAGALRAEVRERDLVGRFGGEEFVVLLAGGPTGDGGTAELTAVAERIRLRIASLYVEMPTPDGPLTVTGLSASVGAAFSPEHGTELRELLQVADTALYAAKRAGRNAVRAGVPAQRSAPVEQAETR